jgi:molybdenum cofactor biosynthesis enzyme MoaA
MEAFSYGAFNRTRIIIDADGLDNNLTSTREAVKASPPYDQLKAYIKKKFNNGNFEILWIKGHLRCFCGNLLQLKVTQKRHLAFCLESECI